MDPLTIIIGTLTLIVTVIIGAISLRYMKKQIHLQEKVATTPSKDLYEETEEKPKLKNLNPLLVTSNDLSELQLQNLTILINGSFQLLESDRLAGSWGKTIGKYMELTQDEGKWSTEDVFKCLLTGSLTHTYHALNGLCEYYKLTNSFFNPNIAFDILYYIKTWRLNIGAFATPVTNFDGSWGNPKHMDGHDADLFSKQIPQLMRHTSCGILAIHRLLELREISRNSYNPNKKAIHKWEEIVEILNDYNIHALQVLSAYSGQIEMGDPSIWGKVRYTPAYVILAINEGLNRYKTNLSEEDRINLERIRSHLIEFAFNNALESGERFFCQFSNKKAFYYYTLLFLESYLNIEKFTTDTRAYTFCEKLIQSLTDVVISTKGLSFGNVDIPNKPWLSYNDIGVTARYLYVFPIHAGRQELNTQS